MFLARLKILFGKIIAVVPPELQAQFDKIQLDNSIRRIRLLTLIALAAKLINAVFKYLANENAAGIFDFIDYSEIAVIALFNLGIFLLKKSGKKWLLWVFCYFVIAGFFILYEFVINSAGRADQIPFIFFVTIFLFSFLPDFKPQVFITFAVVYFIATAYILMLKNQQINEYFGLQSHILNIFLISLVTKILLYNSKVNTFIHTYQINKLNDNLLTANTEIEKQKDDLHNYNENLEKMVQEKTKRIVELKNAVMETMAELVERRDDTTGGHIDRTSRYLKIFLGAVIKDSGYSGLSHSWNIEQMVLSAQLHDVGKIAIADSILGKPGKLDKEEFEIMKSHTVLGGEIIKDIQNKTQEHEFLDYAFTFAVYHHEKWDGSGYPYGKAGEDIPLPSRIMAIIDVYDALISKRPYKEPFTHEEAVKIIEDGKGTHFDPKLVEVFLLVSNQLR